jgi:acyl-CoA dehydrogenase
LTLGGALKRKESISGRLGDILSELYLLSAVLKRWDDEGRQDADLPVVRLCMEDGMARIERSFDLVFANLPNRFAAALMKIVMPMGAARPGASDETIQACADILMEPSATRDRLTVGHFLGVDGDGVQQLERAFALVVETEPLRRKLRAAEVDVAEALRKGIVSDKEAESLEQAAAAVAEVIEVDDFPAESLTGVRPRGKRSGRARAKQARRQGRRGSEAAASNSKSAES